MSDAVRQYEVLYGTVLRLANLYTAAVSISDITNANAIKSLCSDGSVIGVNSNPIQGKCWMLQDSTGTIPGSFSAALLETTNTKLTNQWGTLQLQKLISVFSIFGFTYTGPPGLNNPKSIQFQSDTTLYIANTYANQIIKVVNGQMSVFAGIGTSGFSGDSGPATSAELNNPYNAVVDSSGNVYIADAGNVRVRMICGTPGTTVPGKYNSTVVASANMVKGCIYTIAGDGSQNFSGDGGLATSSQLSDIQDVAVDSYGNVYIADTGNNRVRMICKENDTSVPGKYNSTIVPPDNMISGNIYTIAGDGTQNFSGDGGLGTSAKLYSPIRLAVDQYSNIYINDQGNQRIRILVLAWGHSVSGLNGIGSVIPSANYASNHIYTIAGNGNTGYSNGTAASSPLFNPQGIYVGSDSSVYIADTDNHMIRKIQCTTNNNDVSLISTIAGYGQAGFLGDDGLATSSWLNYPSGVGVDSTGAVYIADSQNNRIRKVVNGIINSIA